MSERLSQMSRRGFGKLFGFGAACITLKPSFVFSARPGRPAIDDLTNAGVVRLSSNENPYGPSSLALKAMSDAFSLAWRYPDEHSELLIEELAKLHEVTSKHILLGNGSGEILKVAASAFTGSNRHLVVGDPTFEAIARYARVANAETVKVPLTSDYRHDLKKMLVRSSGLVYVCNPNNPTASITPKNEIRSYLATVPAGTIVLVDEAYHHYVESADYESVIPLVEHHPNLMVVRTFSKIYGMAGLRCGYCVARPELVRQMQSHQTWDNVNIMALAAATASLPDKAHVEQGRQRNTEVKKYVYAEIERLGLSFIRSQANFLMIDLRRPAGPVIAALRKSKIEVGRVFPALPNLLRVTIGTRPQMEGFVSAFRQVIAATGS